MKISCRTDLFGDSSVHWDSKVHSANAFKEVGYQCRQFNLEKLQKVLYTTLQFFSLPLAQFEGKDYFFSAFFFFFPFYPGSNISCSRTGTTSYCTCHIRCQLLECQFHVTVSCLSQTLCNQQPWGSRGNLTFFQHCRHLDNILLLLESTVQSHSACIQEDLLVLGQHNLTRSSRLLPTAHSSQDCRWAQIQGSRQEQAQARRSLVCPRKLQQRLLSRDAVTHHITSSHQLPVPEMLPTIWHGSANPRHPRRKFTPDPGPGYLFLLPRRQPISCTPFFVHHPLQRPQTCLPPNQITSINNKLLATHPRTPGFLFPPPRYFLNRCLRTSAWKQPSWLNPLQMQAPTNLPGFSGTTWYFLQHD